MLNTVKAVLKEGQKPVALTPLEKMNRKEGMAS